jgi:hypothetical protein
MALNGAAIRSDDTTEAERARGTGAGHSQGNRI